MAKLKKQSKLKGAIKSSNLSGLDTLRNLSKKVNASTPDNDSLPTSLYDGEMSEKQAIAEQLDIRKTLKEILSSKDIVPRDLKIDDSSMPKAKNYYEWVTKEEFLGSDMPPYLEQALIGIKLFAEYCPRCSDLEWMADGGHTAQEGLQGLERHVQLLEYGVCPKCGARRSHLMKRGELLFYNELALNAGQRCVTGDTHVYTQEGIERIGKIGENRAYGFTDFNHNVWNGSELETTSDFYRSKPEDLFNLKLDNGFVLRGTGDHPVWSTGGFIKLRNIKTTNVLPIQVGQNVWGKYRHTVEEAKASAHQSYLRKVLETPDTNRHQVQTCIYKKSGSIDTDLFEILGLWVAEGRGGFISNTHPELLDYIEKTLLRYVSKRYIKRTDVGVKIVGYEAQNFLAELLDLSYEELWSGSACKRIPERVLKAPKEFVLAFLRGLFEGDGGVVQGKKSWSIGYTSLSRELVYDIYAVLTNLGILPRIRKRKVFATNGSDSQVKKDAWCLVITRDFFKLYSEIGFLTEEKRKKFRKAKKDKKRKSAFKHTNYSYMKSEVLQTIQEAKRAFSEIPLPYSERENSGKFRTAKSKKNMGTQTLFGRGDCAELGSSLRKIFKSSGALTKAKLKYISEQHLKYAHMLPTGVVAKFKEYLELCSDNTYCLQVKDCWVEGKEETFDFTLPKTHRFNTSGVISHNSGKSALVAMLSTYVLHLVLKSQKPTQLFRVKSNSMFSGTFVALTYAQAKDTLWEPFYQYVMDAPWFTEYHALIHSYERKYGRELMKLKDTIISYRHRSITFNPAGPDKRSLRGRTRIVAAIDEIAYFDNDKASQKVKYSAAEVYIALERSLRTVRNSENRLVANEYDEAFTGYFFNISSPVSQRDKIMELVRQSQGSKKMLGVHKPTWEMNPDVTREALDDEFRKDYATAMRDYGAEPPMSANPFITSRQLILDTIRPKGKNYVKLHTSIYKQQDGTKYRYGTVKVKAAEGETSVMAIDAGYSNNCFAMAVGSLKYIPTATGEELLCPVIDCVVEVNPLPNIPLHYSMIYEGIMLPLIRERNVKILLADRWQSIKILQDAEMSESLEISKQYSLKFSDMMDVKMRMMQQQIQIPRPSEMDLDEILHMSTDDEYPKCFENKPVEHLLLQMMTVQQGASNVIKGEGLTDDLWRAVCLCAYALGNPDYSEILQRRESITKHTGGKLGVSKLGSSGTGSIAANKGKGVGVYRMGGSSGGGQKSGVSGVGVRSGRR